MATTEIHAIRTTPEAAMGYVMADKYVPYTEGMEIWDDCPYEIVEIPNEVGVPQKYVRYFTLNSFSQCNSRDPMETVNQLRKEYNKKSNRGGVRAKGGEPILWHAHQSFDGREVDPITANKIGLEIAQTVFKGYAVTVSTHTNGNNIHNHFMICAYGYDGRKWNNDLAAYRMLRRESDRLCRENKLSVLETTAEQRLIRFTDAEGKLHYFEPTDRKLRLIEERNAGDISQDDVGSYRNTTEYEKQNKRDLSVQEIIKRDIDALLPVCSSYEDLLGRLRSLGYHILDKRVDGSWRKHISFQPPTAQKATREEKIGDGTFYLRENLTDFLADRAEPETVRENSMHRAAEIPMFDDYQYGETDISQIDLDWRKTRNEFGVEIVVPRRENERKVISDIRQTDQTVRGLIDTTLLRKIIAEQSAVKRQKKPYLSRTQEHRLVAQIMSSFQCLRYTEQHNIGGYGQILALFRRNRDLYAEIAAEISTNKITVSRLQAAAAVPEKAAALEASIAAHTNDVGYQIERQHSDESLLANYKAVMRKYGIDTPQGAAAFQEKVAEFAAKIAQLEQTMEAASVQMEQLENCMRTYDRIDRAHGRADEAAWSEFIKLLSTNTGGSDHPEDGKATKGREDR